MFQIPHDFLENFFINFNKLLVTDCLFPSLQHNITMGRRLVVVAVTILLSAASAFLKPVLYGTTTPTTTSVLGHQVDILKTRKQQEKKPNHILFYHPKSIILIWQKE